MEIIILNIKNIPDTGKVGVLKIGKNLRIKVNSSHESIFRTYCNKTAKIQDQFLFYDDKLYIIVCQF